MKNNYIDTINTIKESPVYKQIMADSFGGIMYDVANHGKYDSSAIESLWASMTPAERESAGGIMKGVFNFLKGDN